MESFIVLYDLFLLMFLILRKICKRFFKAACVHNQYHNYLYYSN